MDALIRRLEEEAREEAARILREARDDAEALETRAREAARKRVEAEAAAGEAELRAHLAERVTAARQTARRRVLAARAALLERVRAEAETLLTTTEVLERYAEALPHLLPEALTFLPGGQATVVCPPALEEAVRAAFAPGGPEVELRTDEATGSGIRLLSADGAVTVDATLADRLRRGWPERRMELADGLGRPAPPEPRADGGG